MIHSFTLLKNCRLLILCFLTLVVAACSSEKETPNGFKFNVVKAGDNVLPNKNEFLVFDFILKDSKDSTWSNTYETGMTGAAMIEDSAAIPTENGMTQMFRMLSKGDSVMVKMPVAKFFKDVVGTPFLPKTIDSTLVLTITLNVKDVMDREAYMTYQSNLQSTFDVKEIDDYLATHNITAEKDTSGIRYVIHRTTGGPKPPETSCVKMRYSGRFMQNERVFDQGEISYPLQNFITGWKYSIPMLGKGDSATFYIPSQLAYGPEGSQGVIPPNAILIFEVALIDFNTTFDPKTRTCIK